MEKQIAIQEDLYDKITRARSNFKKSSKERITPTYLQSRLEALEKYFIAFQENHQWLIKNVSKESRADITYFCESLDEKFEELFYTYKGELKSSIAQFQLSPSAQSQPLTNPAITNIKLPVITIPTFSGNYTEWQSFHDMFSTIIHNNESLENVQRLHYLKSNLSGEAELLLRHIPITDDNYNEAWSMLVNRYSNKRYISNSIFRRFLGQKTINDESSNALKQLLDTSVECINSLKNLNLPVDQWDAIIVYIIVSKLDSESHKQWEETVSNENPNEITSFDKLKSFLERRFRALEMIETSHKVDKRSMKVKSFHSTNSSVCPYCQDKHLLYQCKNFSKQNPEERYEFVQKNNLCFNCFGSNHTVHLCKQSKSCRICGRRHHSLLHRDKRPENTTHSKECSKEPTEIVSTFLKDGQPGQNVLLSTALVNVKAMNGSIQTYRALIDSGSQASFVSQAFVQYLGLKKIPISGVVSGIGEESRQLYINHMVVFTMQSRYNTNFTLQVKAYVLNSLTSLLPSHKINLSNWLKIKDLPLADPYCNVPNKVDILLGAEVHARIITDGLIKHQSGLMAQNTSLGWVISGETNSANTNNQLENRQICLHIQLNLNEELKRFWEIESEKEEKREFSKEEIACEEIYSRTITRDNSGRYVVHLPFKRDISDPIQKCGNTKDVAISRLKQLRKKFEKNKKLELEYTKVMNEYINLGFMKEIENDDNSGIYLPHHAVIREDKETTKLRVVYDASAKGSNGFSLNDTLMVGPTLQIDLRSLILKWRTHKICLVADIIKMYLMVRVTPQHTKYQKIVWFDPADPENKIKTYELLTVTFGTASAPYLAVRSLLQLATDEACKYPIAAEITKQSFYMDDLMTGGENIEEVIEIYNQMNHLLQLGGFKLQKWCSNANEVIDHISKESEVSTNNLEIKLDKLMKILGLTWSREEDRFVFTVNLPSVDQRITKRIILSHVARLYDPFGWLAPVIIKAKMLIQQLWLCNVNWDDELPQHIVTEWLDYRLDLNSLHGLQINRWLHMTKTSIIELHAFADASTTAYAAVVYCKVINGEQVNVNIISSKTKVAPIKQISVPKLELCAAVLLSRLIKDITTVLDVPNHNIFAWTDSQIVLAWLQGHPIRWKVFVANRVTEIIEVLSNERWNYVRSEENPADLASRGVRPSNLANEKLWWEGPEWLKQKNIPIEKKIIPKTELELRSNGQVKTFKIEIGEPIYERYSSLTRLIRVLAYIRRFFALTKKTNQPKNIPIHLTTDELKESLQTCIKICQQSEFKVELEDLSKTGFVKRSSKIYNLSPMLDETGVIRVGGRLQGAVLPIEMKHPIIMPNKNHLTRLLIVDAHLKTLHGGQLLMISYLRSRYWILGLRAMVKQCVHKCITCVRHKASTKNQIMGQLPSVRINPGRPFLRSGVDYAGPIQIRTTKGRGHHATKGYICLFICMVTRAVHLEAVSDLSTQGFIAAFRRFVARRGHCNEVWSDNATNFLGASKELKAMHNHSLKDIMPEVAALLANDGTRWHNIPPEAPNHGGLWEAGIKSTKNHLKRVIGTSTLTFEEISTLLAQIEACLNSRPISQTIDSPNDLQPLTPGHFLIGEPLVTIPDRPYDDDSMLHLTRWQLIQRMTQHFWRRWSCEFLHHLQQRHKWNKHEIDLKVGDVVIIKENNMPPTKWLLGKVLETHPGPDNHVRVVTLQCKGSSKLKRPISKLVYLPID